MPFSPELFDAAHRVRPSADLEARLYTAIALAASGPVLEMGCGTARVMIALLGAAIDVDGVELDADMAEAGRRKLSASGFRSSRISVADMVSYQADRLYKLVTLPGNTLGSLHTTERLARLFANARACLKDDGELAFDVTQAAANAGDSTFEAAIALGDINGTYRQLVRYDSATSMEHILEHVTLDSGEILDNQIAQRVWTRDELECAFFAAGFRYHRPPIDELGNAPSPSSRLLIARLSAGIAL